MRSRNDPPKITVHPFTVESGNLRSWLDQLDDMIDEDSLIVITSSDPVYGPSHVSSAFHHAFRAIGNGTARAKDPSIEVLRWLTGSRQVSRALKISEMKEDSTLLVMITKPTDSDGLLEVNPDRWDNEEIQGLIPVDPEEKDIWGGSRSRSVLAIGPEVPERELELAVLEKVAFTDL